jgi:hypothetical protein
VRRSTVIIALPLLAACSDRSAEPNRIAVHDSSNIRIVDLPSVSTIEDVFEVSSTPVYRVGADETDHVFEDVAAGGLWPDGRAVVGDGSKTLQVVVLSRTGAIEATLGRPGNGPGELRSIFGVLPLKGDTIVVQDPDARRATIFGGGQVVRMIALDTASVLRLLGTHASGDLLMGPPQYAVWGRRFEAPWLSVPLMRVSASTGERTTLGSVDWDQSIAGSGAGDSPFMSGGFATAINGGFVTGRGDRPELKWYDPQGGLRQIVRWREQPQPVSDDMIDAYGSRVRASMTRRGVPEPQIQIFIAGVKGTIREPVPFFGVPGPMPGFGGLIGDQAGNVWIAAYTGYETDAVRRYYVMSSEGEWLGRADLPRRSKLLAAGTDRVLVVERDTLDVQTVSVYEIRKPAK